MAGQRVGYQRVSTADQSIARQLDGVAVDRVFIYHVSGATRDWPTLHDLRRYVRAGDTVVVHSMDRLARNLDDLRALVRELTAAGVAVELVKEHMAFTGADTPMEHLMLSLLGAVAESERALGHERQREGIKLAKRRGDFKGRPLPDRGPGRRAAPACRRRHVETELARRYGIHRDTVYRT